MRENKEKDIHEKLNDLIFLNSIIATELIKITENTSRMARGEKPPESCLSEHADLEKRVIDICEKNNLKNIEILKKHVLQHEK